MRVHDGVQINSYVPYFRNGKIGAQRMEYGAQEMNQMSGEKRAPSESLFTNSTIDSTNTSQEGR